MRGAGVKQVYRVTFPNGKVYIGMDLTGTTLYLGSPRKDLVAADLGLEGSKDFTLTIRKEILWESESASDAEVRRVEAELIVRERANDPQVGYNLWPRLRPGSSGG